MSKFNYLWIASTLIAAIGNFSNPAFADEPSQFSLACVGTETGESISFEYRWGKQETWTQTSIAPGKWKVLKYHYDYPGQNRSPQLQIRYYQSAFSPVLTDLDVYAASDTDCEKYGKTYNFYRNHSELYVVDEESNHSASNNSANVQQAACVGAMLGALLSGNSQAIPPNCSQNSAQPPAQRQPSSSFNPSSIMRRGYIQQQIRGTMCSSGDCDGFRDF